MIGKSEQLQFTAASWTLDVGEAAERRGQAPRPPRARCAESGMDKEQGKSVK